MTVISSETILRAASLMKGRALAATASPWTASPVLSENGATWCAVYSRANPATGAAFEVITSAIRPGGEGANNPNDIDHTAGMQPSVAIAVADWLESCGKALAATSGDHLAGCDEPASIEAAFTIARTYLGEHA